MVVVVKVVKKLRHYLVGVSFTIVTDHNSLQLLNVVFLFTQFVTIKEFDLTSLYSATMSYRINSLPTTISSQTEESNCFSWISINNVYYIKSNLDKNCYMRIL